MLRLDIVNKSFDGVKAVRDVTVAFQPKTVYALIGPNGAGKTTLLNIINGFIKPDMGKIFIKGKDATGNPPYKIARMEVGRLFQDIRVFPKMKVIDNVLLASEFEVEENPLLSLLKTKSNRKKEEIYIEKAKEYLKEFDIEDKKDSYAEDLSFGQEKLLSLSRLFMADFDILLLDEPVAGVNPQVKEIIYRKIREMACKGKLIIVVEHEMEAIRRVADYVFFMNDGEIVREGKPAEVLEDKKVIEEYVGLESSRFITKAEDNYVSDNVLLRTENLYAAYYKREILRGVNIEIREGEIVALIGPNGAGKSTLLKVLAGVLEAKKGKIYINKNENFADITYLSARGRVRMGIGYFIQGGEVFSDLLVEENLDISAIDMCTNEREKQKTMLFGLFPLLWEKIKLRAGLLSGGERQMLALAMVLMKKPKILLWLDEPSAGLAPKYREEVLSKIREIRDMFSTSILLVEQRVGEILSNTDRVYIMKTGKIVEESASYRINIDKVEGIFMGNHDGSDDDE